MEERYSDPRREAPPERRSDYQDDVPRRQGGRLSGPFQQQEPYRREPSRRQESDWDDRDDWDDGRDGWDDEDDWDGRDDWDGDPPRRGVGSRAVAVLMGFYKVLVALSIIVVAVYLGSKVLIRTPDQNQLTPPSQDGTQGDSGGGLTPSGVGEGMDRRKGVYNIFLTATDKGGTLTDVMMVMCYDTNEQTVGVVSIPRDTLVAREKGNPRLVYGGGGVEQRIVDVSEMLGVPIDYYIKVDIEGFIALVDYLGGIDFYVPCDMDYDDPTPGQDLQIHFKEGQQHLTGQQAMEVARFRKDNKGRGYSDTGRTETQQKLLIALAKKVLSWGSLTKINGFVKFFNENVDTDLSMNDMLYFASQGINVDPSTSVKTATLEGRGDGVYHGVGYCYELDAQKALETVNELINPYTEEMTLDNMKIAKAQSYR